MRRNTSRFAAAGLAAVLGILGAPHAASAQALVDQPVPPYNPYPLLPGSTPPTVLPPDLQPEIYRVRREVQTIFDRYFAEWQKLTPPVLSNTQGEGNPPVLQGTGYDAVRILGGLLNYDENMSPFRNQACSCWPHAVCGVHRTDPVSQSNDGRVSGNVSLSSQQANNDAVPVCTLLRQAPIQSVTGPVLRRRILECACDRIQAPESRRRSRRSIRWSIPGKWASPIRLASRCGYLRRRTGRSLSWFGAWTSTSIGPPMSSRSAPHPEGISRPLCQLR
jgi:hypothetical protein